MDDIVEDTATDSMDGSVSDFTKHLLMIEQQLESDPLNQTLISVKNDIIQFLELANNDIPGSIDVSQTTDHMDIVIGGKYSIQCTNYAGDVASRNCIIMEIESSTNSAVVLFTHPTDQSMVPCQYFLDGNCKFDTECRLSHGYKVDLSFLESYEELNISQAQEDSACLVYSEEESIWNKGIVVQIDDTSCDVWLERLNKKVQVPVSDVFLVKTRMENDSGLSGEESEFECRTIQALSSSPTHEGVYWEKHTRGIGSKLMSKMGYTPGSGLGVEGNGIREPVEIVVLPKGRSLDQCMESKRTGGVNHERKKPNCKKHVNIKKREFKQQPANSVNLDVFDFLNDSIQLQQLVHGEHEREEKKQLTYHNRDSNKGLDLSSSIRIQLDSQLRDTRAEVEKLKLSLCRNKKDSVIAKQLEIKLKKRERELSLLEQEEVNILSKISSQKKRANMSVF